MRKQHGSKFTGSWNQKPPRKKNAIKALMVFAVVLGIGMLGVRFLDPQRASAQLPEWEKLSNMAQQHLSTDGAPEAVALLSKAVELNPNSSLLFAELADARLQTGSKKGALDAINRAIDLNDKSAEQYKLRGDIYYDLKQYDQAKLDYDMAIKLKPGDSDWISRRAITCLELNDLAGAIKDAAFATRDKKNAPSIAWLVKAQAFLRQGNPESAIADFDRALSKDPLNDAALIGRGKAKMELGDFDEALDDMTRAIQLNPEVGEYFRNRGKVRMAKGNLTGAIADLGKNIQLDPDNPQAYLLRANARRTRGDVGGAIRDFDKAIELSPDESLLWLARGKVRASAGDRSGAIADFNHVIRMDPKNIEAYCVRADSKEASGDYGGALQDLGRAIELDSQNAYAFCARADIHRTNLDLADAVKDFTEAIRLNPHYSYAYYGRGMAYMDQGKVDEGRLDLRWVVDHSTDAHLVKMATEELRRSKLTQ